MKNKPIQDKVGSILARSSVFLVSLFTISILVVTDISEVSARGRGGGGGGRSSGGGRSFGGGGGRSFSGARSGSGNLRYSGSNRNRGGSSRDTRQRQRTRDTAGQRDFNRQNSTLSDRRQNRPDNRNDRQGDRQDFLNDSRNDRQDWRDNNREDRQSYGKERQKDRHEFIEDNYYRGRYGRRYYGGGVVIGATIAVLPSNCSTLYWSGARYYNCNNVYYQPTYRGGSTTFVVVKRPH